MIRKRREEKDMSVSEVSRRLCISKGYLSQLETHPHECNPTLHLILSLSKELDLHRIMVFEYFASAMLEENEELFWYI
jgi:transcriptional regulator with XRE-family HTH domain